MATKARDKIVSSGCYRNGEWNFLMALAQKGNAVAYERLLAELSAWLRRFYARRLPHPLVEDAVQDTLIAIHEKRHLYDSQRPFKPWLIAVARYKWVDRLRSLGRTPTQELPEDLAVADHESSVTSTVLLERLLENLKPAQSAAIRLVKLEGFSVEEASAKTGQSCALIKVNIHRGLSYLSHLLGSGLIDHSQKSTVAARARAEKNTVGQRS